MDDINLSSMDLVERADKAMYLAKKAGKNCVEFYS
jgi:GGDEF domain-containing protein